MNPKVVVITAAIACLTLFAVLMMDDDGAGDENKETEGGDEFFEWPSVSDPSAGSVRAEAIEEEQVTFIAEPSDGFRFVYWIGIGGRVVAENPVAIPVVESGDWMAVFEEEII